MSLKFKKHPGREYVKVICDVCGGLFYQKDTIQITNKYNFQNGLVVCLADVDQINEQVLPNNHIDRPITRPDLLRPERFDEFSINLNDNRLPSAPRVPFAQVDPINDYVDLYWQGPEDTGSSEIVGYKVVRANPQLGTYEVLSINTGSGATFYQDTGSNINLEYSYKIAAINSFGVGAYSSEFFWPKPTFIWEDINYLVLSQNGNAIAASDTGYLIRLNHIEEGIK